MLCSLFYTELLSFPVTLKFFISSSTPGTFLPQCLFTGYYAFWRRHPTLLADLVVPVCFRQAQLLSHVGFVCKSMTFSLPGFSVHGLFQARVLEWVMSLALAGRCFITRTTWEALMK